ncbi:recombination regulator RecX [Undibacterium fentianense]|uniref:Regulatory protein RecX n=1 Tax=Undibacterium fentianense TaxID=2828728 RepID=A0A941E4Z1_9BURK|nr:recombination regulator RecX [Undibacterium fentianense]MBR7801147.1 recombination regulator RecX [Undibacterium fentianense]
MKIKLSLKGRALRYLSMREHSRQELGRKLTPYLQEQDDLEALLDWLESAKFLSDQRFSEALVHRRQGRFGNQRILAELQNHQLDKEDLIEIKENLESNELQRAVEVLWKKFANPPQDPKEKAKQMQFLAQRGFTSRAIRHALGRPRDLIDE